MESVVILSNNLLEYVSNDFVRSLMQEIDWKQKLIEIRGSRGVGKTTLMLQKANTLKKWVKSCICVVRYSILF